MKSNRNIRRCILLYWFVVIGGVVAAQHGIQKQLPTEKRYTAFEVTDERYGINVYDPLILRLNGDSVRHCKGYSCRGWIIDYYVNGKVLHKGYYTEGHLKIFKNFFQNGKVERDFRVVDDQRCNLAIYYASGNIKSEQRYKRGEAIEWKDYYENGNLEYHELYHRSFNYYITQVSNYEDGTTESTLELTNKKKLIFTKKKYHPNGKVKEEGELIYSESMFDYQKKGKWLFFNEDGTPRREEVWVSGELNKEKDY